MLIPLKWSDLHAFTFFYIHIVMDLHLIEFIVQFFFFLTNLLKRSKNASKTEVVDSDYGSSRKPVLLKCSEVQLWR